MSVTGPHGSTSLLVTSGPVPATVMVFGESRFCDRGSTTRIDPGDLLFHRALADVGIEPDTVRFTSAIKPDAVGTGHGGPNRVDVGQSEPTTWMVPLVAEVRRVQARVLVLLGSSAGSAVLGAGFAPRRQRGCLLPAPERFELETAPVVLVTAHPSTVHRSRHRAFDYAAMVRDLRAAADLLEYRGGDGISAVEDESPPHSRPRTGMVLGVGNAPHRRSDDSTSASAALEQKRRRY